MTVTWDTNEWIVGSSVRGYGGKDGEEVFDELSETVKDEDAVLEAIEKMSMDFHARREEGLRKFRVHFGAVPND